MSRTIQTLLGTSLIVTLMASASFAADLTIVSTTTFNGKSSTATQYISDNKVRYADGQSDVIMNYADGTMVTIDHKKKTYSETTLEEMRAQMAEMSEMLEGNPIMERMMGPPGATEVEKLGDTKEIAGYPCTHYKLTMGPKFEFDFWVTEELEMPISYYDARKMAYAAMGPVASRFDKMFEEMKKVKGVPLASTSKMKVMGMKLDSEQTATQVTVGDLPADAFAVPAYKKKKSAYK